MTDRIDGIIDRVSDAEEYEKASWLLGNGVLTNFAVSVIDDTIKANVDFQGKAGIPVKVKRYSIGYCCKWCNDLIGTYRYPDVPDEVWHRHQNCNCVIEYTPAGGGRVDKLVGRTDNKGWELADPATMKRRKNFAGVSTSPTPVKQAQTKTLVVAGHTITEEAVDYDFYNGVGKPPKKQPAIRYTTQDGTEFYFKTGMDPNHQKLTHREVIKAYYDMPLEVRERGQKQIVVTDIYNPDDAYWRKHYKSFNHSYATGGDTIHFWRYDGAVNYDYVVETLEHESGHFIDKRLGVGGARYSDSFGWQNAIKQDKATTGKSAVTKYAANAPTEDFAESVALYSNNPQRFLTEWPTRGKLLESIFRNTDIGIFK